MRADSRAIAALDAGRPGRAVEDRIRIALLEPTGLSGKVVAALIVSLLVLSAVGLALGVGAFGPPAGDGIAWRNEVALLRFREMRLEVNGLVFSGSRDVEVGGDVGGPTNWSLGATWVEAGLPLRLSLDFEREGSDWYIRQIRALVGPADGDWVVLRPAVHPAPDTGAPIGKPLVGDFDFEGDGRSGLVRLHLGGVELHVSPRRGFAAPPDGGIVLPRDARPFGPSGVLFCSGILQMTPADAHAALLRLGYRVVWRAASDSRRLPDGPETETPPEGVIWAAHEPVVSTDGALVIGVLPFSDSQAVPAPMPGDCLLRGTPAPGG
jgi:hypothetical protein